MSDSKPPISPRTTLKLKGAPRQPPKEQATAPEPPVRKMSKLKPGAHWSDEHKERMQADMDALTTRRR
jgi:hypothetical protein